MAKNVILSLTEVVALAKKTRKSKDPPPFWKIGCKMDDPKDFFQRPKYQTEKRL